MNRFYLIAVALLSSCVPWTAQAHDVPDRVNIAVFVKPEQDHLVILVRMPANALIDFLLPTLAIGNWVDLANADSLAQQAANVWIADLLSFREGDRQLSRPKLLAVRLSRVNDPSFATFEDALSRIKGAPLSPDTLALQEQLTVDALLQTPIDSPASAFFFEPRFARLGVLVETSLTFLPTTGGLREFRYQSDPETFELDAGRWTVAKRFLSDGFSHYFKESDYLLLVLCLALIFRNLRTLLPFVAVLAGAQVLSLFVALDALTAAPWIRSICGTAISAAIVYTGSEAIIAGEGKRIALAAVLGIIFGYGFWIGLQPVLQFGGAHAVTAGIGFIIGVIAAELLTLMLSIAAVHLLLWSSRASRAVVIVVAGVVMHIAWRRLLDRADAMALVPLDSRGIQSTTLITVALAILAALIAGAHYMQSHKKSRKVG